MSVTSAAVVEHLRGDRCFVLALPNARYDVGFRPYLMHDMFYVSCELFYNSGCLEKSLLDGYLGQSSGMLPC